METQIINILQKLGLTQKESKIFLFLYKYGKKPASTIAKAIGDERTNTYKTLKKLVKNGLLAEIKTDNATLFFVPNRNIFQDKLEAEIQELEQKKEKVKKLNELLKDLNNQIIKEKPSIILFEGIDGVKNLYKDIISQVKKQGLKSIKFFSSNTLENRGVNMFKEYYPDFFDILKQLGVGVQTYLGNGIEILETITKAKSDDIDLGKLPAGNSTLQVFVVGDVIYIIIFKQIPYGIKIEFEELAQLFHFLFNKIAFCEDEEDKDGNLFGK